MSQVMAKKKNVSGLPSLGDDREPDEVDVQESETVTVARVEYKTITIRVPFVSDPVEVNWQDKGRSRADPGKLTREEMRKLRAIRRGCSANAESYNGQEVEKNCHVLRWLLAQVDI